MQETRLYTVSLPGHARTRAGQRNQQRVAANASLSSQGAGARSLGSEPGERTLDVQYKGPNSELMSKMLSELAQNANGYDVVPWFAVDDNGVFVHSEINGWYAVERAEQAGENPRVPAPSTVSLSLRKTGTTKTVWRRLSIQRTVANVEGIIDDPSTGRYIVAPGAAKTVQWWDGESATAGASATSTAEREFGVVAFYDLDSAPFDADSLLYQVPYNTIGLSDLKVWDTHGHNSKTTQMGGEWCLQWQKVFAPSHEFESGVIFDNSRTRLYFDEETGEYRVDLLDTAAGGWVQKASNANSDWEISDVDIIHIGPSRVTAHVIWIDSSGGATYPLRVSLRRGIARPKWYRPPNRVDQMAAVPTDLADVVGSWSNKSTWMLATQCGVIERQEVR